MNVHLCFITFSQFLFVMPFLWTGGVSAKATRELFEGASKSLSKSVSCSRVSSGASNDFRQLSPREVISLKLLISVLCKQSF